GDGGRATGWVDEDGAGARPGVVGGAGGHPGQQPEAHGDGQQAGGDPRQGGVPLARSPAERRRRPVPAGGAHPTGDTRPPEGWPAWWSGRLPVYGQCCYHAVTCAHCPGPRRPPPTPRGADMAEFSLELSDDQKQIQEWVHDFAANVLRPNGEEWDEREETPWPIIQEAAKIGLYGMDFMAQAMMGDPTGLTLPVAMEELFW